MNLTGDLGHSDHLIRDEHAEQLLCSPMCATMSGRGRHLEHCETPLSEARTSPNATTRCFNVIECILVSFIYLWSFGTTWQRLHRSRCENRMLNPCLLVDWREQHRNIPELVCRQLHQYIDMLGLANNNLDPCTITEISAKCIVVHIFIPSGRLQAPQLPS